MPVDIDVKLRGEGTETDPFVALNGEFTEEEFNRLKIITIEYTAFYIRYNSQLVLMDGGRAVYPEQKAA